ncbi:MAG: SsrA-binding protein SmpB [Candidatus Gracilibacteria bacterium]
MDIELTKNKKAYFDYEVVDTYDAGIVLKGYEAKSIRAGKMQLKGGFISFRNEEAWMENVLISPYQPKNQPEESGQRRLKLLLQKKQILKIINQSEEAGMTVIPLKAIVKDHRIKIVIGLCRGKKKFDKRESIKKRELDRSTRHQFKTR